MKLYTGHLPDVVDGLRFGDETALSVDLLLTVHDDGTHQVAWRPGTNRRDITWSPPVTLTPEPADITPGSRP